MLLESAASKHVRKSKISADKSRVPIRQHLIELVESSILFNFALSISPLALTHPWCFFLPGDCCSVSCDMASTLDTPYTCQGPDLDRYTCRDPMYVDDVVFSGTAAYPSLAISKFHPRGYMSVAIVAVVSLGVVTINFGGAWWY